MLSFFVLDRQPLLLYIFFHIENEWFLKKKEKKKEDVDGKIFAENIPVGEVTLEMKKPEFHHSHQFFGNTDTATKDSRP